MTPHQNDDFLHEWSVSNFLTLQIFLGKVETLWKLHPPALICWRFLCQFTFEIFAFKVISETAVGCKNKNPSSDVTAAILYGRPHGMETVRSALPTQCPFQARCQWGLYAALTRSWMSLVSSSEYLSPPRLLLLCVLFSLSSFHFSPLRPVCFLHSEEPPFVFALPPVKHKAAARWESS